MQLHHLFQQSIYLLSPLKKELAYLDPGFSSVLLQLLLASLLGGLFLVRRFWSRIKAFFSRLFSKNKAIEPQENEQPGNEQ